LFVRRFKKKAEEYKSNSFEWIVDDFSQTKYSSYWYAKNNWSGKIAGGIIENIIKKSQYNAG
jgi:hypothetical protein